jgi:hypothetical protein
MIVNIEIYRLDENKSTGQVHVTTCKQSRVRINTRKTVVTYRSQLVMNNTSEENT